MPQSCLGGGGGVLHLRFDQCIKIGTAELKCATKIGLTMNEKEYLMKLIQNICVCLLIYYNTNKPNYN